MSTHFRAEQLFDGQQWLFNVDFCVEAGRIVSLGACSSKRQPQQLFGKVVPGFIDIQVNGGGGVLFNSTPSQEGIRAIAKAHARFGTTAMLPTLITDDISAMTAASEAMALAIAAGTPGILGIHFEGPHLSVPKKGVHPAPHIRRIADAELHQFCRQDLGLRLVTLAPENVSADVIRQLVNAGVKVCLGHSNADYDTAMAAITAGADGFTHLFNAMSALGSREPGMVGAALDSDAWCGLIMDGHHVHAASARIAIRAKSPGKVLLVTDAMPPVGDEENNSFELFGQEVIRDGDRLNASTGELAGCVLDMASAVRNSVNMLGLSLEEALRMASLYPAQYLDIAEDHGHLQVGARADFVVLDESLTVAKTFIGGELVSDNV
ncbi:N-acetylglucosamine-6-phosphate deacetylase [Shewanella sp. NIFS-20-20]|uniref:N-acetylglucosamine-6-phosphate deacetylase n=1 Tax=Shewanella sp. NIFS-20-20 TaxID=2853806 RepID=UPI001C4960B4|nr:N-acetylglucosamine-6-phosphate deacetylase [Shewanella sp. NIFS-20-20]MBV7315437.1 N-acetylglucosamine-6-phosphate deacetylase [Shewanella sp. NIFS-20-20]